MQESRKAEIELAIAEFAAGKLSRGDVERRLCTPSDGPEAIAELRALFKRANSNGVLTDRQYAELAASMPTRFSGPFTLVEDATLIQETGAPAAPLRVPLRAVEPQGLQPGRILNGKYRLDRMLGSGGMGVVFLAHDLIGTEPVAIKVLRAELRDRPEILAALRDEVTQSRKLRHENIVGVYGLEQDGADPYIVMEYLQGKNLRALLDEDYVRGLQFTRAWPILSGIGAALSFAHDRGVIHSDLKPENVFLTTAGIPKVLDFGIARAIRKPADRIGGQDRSAFTPAYASCELIEGQPPDFADDVYGFACVAYEILTGRKPFNGALTTRARDEGLKPAAVASLSDLQNSNLRRGLAFRRQDRFGSIEEFMKGLEVPSTSRGRWWIAAGVGAALLGAAAWFGSRGQIAVSPPAGRAVEPVARAAREAGETFRDCDVGCPEMIVIPAGKFMMGSPPEESGRRTDEGPHEISFLHPFALGVYPVTTAEFRRFEAQTGYRPAARCENLTNRSATNPPTFDSPGFPQSDGDPAVCVSMADARAYAAWLNGKVDAQVYRLPSEAEWEYAARAGTGSASPWTTGDSQACRFGNFGDRSYLESGGAPSPDEAGCDDRYPATSPVGSFPKNAWGLFDMLGNVFEWTEGCNQQLDSTNGDAYLTDCQKYGVVRGAGFSSTLGGDFVRYARRTIPPPSAKAANTWGFRLARSL